MTQEYDQEITLVYVYKNGMVLVFDQKGNQIPELQGMKAEVLPRIKEVYDGIINYDVEWIR